MPTFQFQAIDQQGQVQTGTLYGSSMDAVAKNLAEKGLTVQQLGLAETMHDPTRVAPKAETPRSENSAFRERSKLETDVVGPLVGTVPLADLNFLFRQLGSMLNAGIAPVQTFETLSRQTKNQKLKRILLETGDRVTAGEKMSSGFERYPEVFSPLVLNMIRVGEEGGFMSDQCSRIADYLERDIELRNMIRRETAYPKTVFYFSIFLILGVNLLLGAIAPGAQKLPMMLGLWLTVGAIWFAWFIFKRFGLRNEQVRKSWDGFVAGVPWLGNMITGFAMAKFGRAFGALYGSGVPLGKATILAADSCGNEHVRSRIIPFAPQIESGESVAQSFAQSGAFSPIVVDMAQTGEMTGNLDQMMQKVAEYYEDEGRTKARQSATILGVVCLLLAGIYVAYILINFYSGYFSGQLSGLQG